MAETKKEYYEAKYDVEKKIKELKRNQILTSDHPSMKLKQLLKENLVAANGAEVPVHILCEVIDVKNETWKNAVEGYLHTQKFDLLVPTGYFDDALSCYERYKFTHQIERVGLVNTDKIIEEQRRPLFRSLAEEVTTNIDYVQAYVNRLLGALIKCESERELKNINVVLQQRVWSIKIIQQGKLPEKDMKFHTLVKKPYRCSCNKKSKS